MMKRYPVHEFEEYIHAFVGIIISLNLISEKSIQVGAVNNL